MEINQKYNRNEYRLYCTKSKNPFVNILNIKICALENASTERHSSLSEGTIYSKNHDQPVSFENSWRNSKHKNSLKYVNINLKINFPVIRPLLPINRENTDMSLMQLWGVWPVNFN